MWPRVPLSEAASSTTSRMTVCHHGASSVLRGRSGPEGAGVRPLFGAAESRLKTAPSYNVWFFILSEDRL